MLSGYLIALMWLSEVARRRGRFSYGTFMLRRLLRIWPALACALAAFAAFLAAARAVSASLGDVDAAASYDKQLKTCGRQSWTILLFLNNLLPSDCLAQTWSVAAEMQFYLVSPLIMWLVYSPARMAPRRRFGGVAALFALSTIGVVLRLAIMLAFGPEVGFITYGLWPPPFSYTLPFMRTMPYLAGRFLP